jgi:DNA/RNA endonuclease YhcR with UshA esterase domain
MKTLQILVLVAISLPAFSQARAAQTKTALPRYDKSSEAVFIGSVQEVRDRQCAVSGGIGSHLVMRLTDGKVIEVHLSSTRFVHQYELVFHSGETLEITGVKVNFEGVETILARKIKRGTDEFLFRDNDGKPIW